jgi:hypothetical protein
MVEACRQALARLLCWARALRPFKEASQSLHEYRGPRLAEDGFSG